MDYERFNSMTRDLASGVSRRQSLKLLGGSLAGGLLAFFGIGSASDRRFNIGGVPSHALANDRSANQDIRDGSFELLSYQATGYRFQIIPLSAAPPFDWWQPGFDDSNFGEGSAPFGSGGACPVQSTVQTSWPTNSRLLVRQVVSVPPGATNVRVMVSINNDILGIFFNGQPITHFITHDGCPILDEFRFNVPASLVQPGNNLVAFHVMCRGEEGFFDARILAELELQTTQAITTCFNTNFVSMPCEELNAFIRDCGVICPDGTRLPGKGGCTVCLFKYVLQPYSIRYQNFLGQLCASATVTAKWVTLQLESTTISYSPNPPPCCAGLCLAEIDQVKRQLEAHEAGHRANYLAARAQADIEWKSRSFRACAETEDQAARELRAKIFTALQMTEESIKAKCEMHPPEARPIECSKCAPPTNPTQRCVNGRCLQPFCTQSSICPRPGPDCGCSRIVDCSRPGQLCLCVRSTEGNIRCARSAYVCPGTSCSTSAGCERSFGPGWFCQDINTSCCPGTVCQPPC